MAQRLFRVRVERIHEVVVIAEDECEAEEIAYDAVAEDDGGLGKEQLVTEALPLTDQKCIPHGWDVRALPYGEDKLGERPIVEILKAES